MIEYIDYIEEDNNVSVGFKVNNFVIYSQISKIDGYEKKQYLQTMYEKCKRDIEYEKTLVTHSIVTDKDGEQFIPEPPKLKSIELILKNGSLYFENDDDKTIQLSATGVDQYGELFDVVPHYSSTFGETQGDTLIVNKPELNTVVSVTCSVGNIFDTKPLYLKIHTESIEDKIANIRSTLDDINYLQLNETVIQQSAVLEEILFNILPDLMIGGMGGE